MSLCMLLKHGLVSACLCLHVYPAVLAFAKMQLVMFAYVLVQLRIYPLYKNVNTRSHTYLHKYK